MAYILLVRHGENEWVKEHRLAGWIEGVHLNENGREQARHTAAHLAHLPLTNIYSSPLERCRETAELIAHPHQLPVQLLPEIGEVRYGDWEGQKIAELAKEPLWQVVQHFPSRLEFPAGETLRGVQSRAVEVLEGLGRAHPEQMVVVCSHADLIKLVLAHYLGVHMDLFQRIVISPASVSIVHLPANGRVHILRLNDDGPIKKMGGEDPKDEPTAKEEAPAK